MRIQGRLVIAGILLLGLVAASLAWWHQYRQGDQVLGFWGAAAARQIRLAPRCQLWRLGAGAPPDPTSQLKVAGQVLAIQDVQDLSAARGLVHARQALIQDASYDWSADPPREPPTWDCALVFANESQQTVVAIDLQTGFVCDVATGRLAHVGPILVGLREFLAPHPE